MAPLYTLVWLPEHQCYALSQPGQPDTYDIQEQWRAWLDACSSFAFEGKNGHLTLRKEPRKRGESYWYAYCTRNRRTRKRYAGRSTDLTIAKLEEIARLLTATEPAPRTAPTLTLLETKLSLPRLQTSLLSRSSLLDRLNLGLERKLTLISAPAGFGKTTIVRQWLNSRTEPVAWLSLDAGDNDPARFWRYVVAACRALLPDQGQQVLALFATPSQPPFTLPPLEAILTTFLNALAHCNAGLLVLEDYHVITDPCIHETLAFFLDHLPPTLHIVLIARGDPPLPLVRLRARNELHELHAHDLRFSPEETRAFLTQELAFTLTPETLNTLSTRLEGWPAGLRLLTIMLQGCETQTEAETRLHTFAGEHRPILDYFVSEVLNAQPESLQSFLLHTSMLSRLTGSLCMAVTGNPASDALLETLEQAHLFLEPLDGLWYRYHALFAEAMQHEAKRHLGEATLQAISSKASYWYEEHSMLEEAVDAALYACDFSHAATIIERFVDFNALTYIPTLHRWLQQLPFETLKQHPTLCLNYAITQFFTHFADFIHMTGRFPQTERAQFEEPLQLAQQVWQAEGNIPRLGEVFAFQSLLSSSFSGEMQQAVEYAKKALDYLDEKELAWRSTCLRIIGLTARRRGDLNEARRTITEASALSETIGNRPIARLTTLLLGIVCAEQGELQQAAAYYQQVLDEARAQADPTDIGPALLCLAQLAYERNRLDEAEQQLAEANQLRSQLPEETCRRIQLLMALLEHARGQSENALERLTNLLARLQPVHALPLYREVLTYQARIQLALSDLSAARRSYEKLRMLESTLPDYAEQEALLLARLQLVDGKAQAALDLLHTILPQATKAGRIRRAFEIQLLLSLAYTALKQPQEARQRLYSTLHQTRSEGYIRLFLDEGDALLGLLQSLFGSLREKPLLTYLRTILQAATPARQALASPPSALIEPLSPQERRVLRLLAAGHSNPEIARELVVSVNTVRTQVQSIYRKLGVSNRVAASEAARSFHLLP